MKKRGISDVITTVLIILLVLAAIVIVWQVVKKTVTEGVGNIDTAILSVSLSIKDVYINYNSKLAQFSVTRGADSVNVSQVKIVVTDADSNLMYLGNAPMTLETKVYTFNITGLGNLVKIAVYPVSAKGKLGIPAIYNVKNVEPSTPPQGFSDNVINPGGGGNGNDENPPTQCNLHDDCGSKVCGYDGCGNENGCGSCPGEETCSSEGQCVTGTPASCTGTISGCSVIAERGLCAGTSDCSWGENVCSGRYNCSYWNNDQAKCDASQGYCNYNGFSCSGTSNCIGLNETTCLARPVCNWGYEGENIRKNYFCQNTELSCGSLGISEFDCLAMEDIGCVYTAPTCSGSGDCSSLDNCGEYSSIGCSLEMGLGCIGNLTSNSCSSLATTQEDCERISECSWA